MDGQRPHFMREWQQNVPPQLWGTNTCGIHVTLNGWAYQLPVDVDERWQPSKETYEDA